MSKALTVAFLLVSTAAGAECVVLKQLKEFDLATQAYCIHGPYNILVKVEGKSVQDVKDTISRHIQFLENMVEVRMLLAAESSETQRLLAAPIP